MDFVDLKNKSPQNKARFHKCGFFKLDKVLIYNDVGLWGLFTPNKQIYYTL